jgi:hypothetical protein
MDKKFWEFLDTNVPKFATEQKLVLPRLKKIIKTIDTGSITTTEK